MNFQMDVGSIKQSIASSSSLYRNLKARNNDIYRNIFYSRECWDDINSYKFVDDVKRNSIKIDDFLIKLESYNNYFESLLSSYNTLCKKYSDGSNLKSLKYNDANLKLIISYLTRVLEIMNSISRSSSSLYYLDVETTYNPNNNIQKASYIRGMVNELISDLNDFTSGITEYADSFKSHVGELDYNLPLTKMNAIAGHGGSVSFANIETGASSSLNVSSKTFSADLDFSSKTDHKPITAVKANENTVSNDLSGISASTNYGSVTAVNANTNTVSNDLSGISTSASYDSITAVEANTNTVSNDLPGTLNKDNKPIIAATVDTKPITNGLPGTINKDTKPIEAVTVDTKPLSNNLNNEEIS